MSFSSPLALNFNSHLHLNRSRRILPLTIIKFLSNEFPIRFSLSFSLSRCREIILLLSPFESLVEELAAATDAFDLGSLSSYQNFSSTLEAPFTTLAICDWPVYIDDDLLLPRASRSVIFSFPNSAKPHLLGSIFLYLGGWTRRHLASDYSSSLLCGSLRELSNAFLLASNTWIKNTQNSDKLSMIIHSGGKWIY